MADTDIHLPDEIVNNILVRLPTKSLTRFRCVSKRWNLLISDPDLMKSLSRRKIFIPGHPYCQTIKKVENDNRYLYRMVRAHSPKLFKDRRPVTVGGTTNGLVLLVVEFHQYSPASNVIMKLYNPLTRVLKKVPKIPFINKIVVAFGLGHGATQDDVKIVTLLGPNRSNKTSSSLFSLGVFSVKNQSWSAMSESSIGYFAFPNHAGTFLNGFLYWSVCCKDEYVLILALDIKEMKLVEMEVPYDDRRVRYPTMGTINGCLCLLNYYNDLGDDLVKYELLVMKDHGIWESRFKGCSTSTVLSRMISEDSLVRCILDEGKVIMKNREKNNNSTYLFHDVLKDSLEGFIICTDLDDVFTTETIEYVESFCSI